MTSEESADSGEFFGLGAETFPFSRQLVDGCEVFDPALPDTIEEAEGHEPEGGLSMSVGRHEVSGFGVCHGKILAVIPR